MSFHSVVRMQDHGFGQETSRQLKSILQNNILRNYPNPERRGCPGSAVLILIAKKKRPFEDPRWQHVTQCSPCYEEFLSYRPVALRRRSLYRRLGRLAVVGVLILGGSGVWLFRHHARSVATVAQNRVESVAIHIGESPVRGPSSTAAAVAPPEQLPRAYVHATIYLPLGAQSGTYTFELLKEENNTTPLLNFRAAAIIQDGFTVAQAYADLAKIPPGPYLFRFRRELGAWRYSNITVSSLKN